jgi:hypothetical protein
VTALQERATKNEDNTVLEYIHAMVKITEIKKQKELSRK